MVKLFSVTKAYFDGSFVKHIILQTRLPEARTKKKGTEWPGWCNECWSLPHLLIYSALSAAGRFLHLSASLKNIYNDYSSKILSNDSANTLIPIKGLKRAAQIKGILFNLSYHSQADTGSLNTRHWRSRMTLLFVLPEELQDLLDLVHCEMGKIDLSLNQSEIIFYLSGLHLWVVRGPCVSTGHSAPN
ncbi:hypothetical protein AVEN_217876-1 [Araneus ventricosus]|uniref:Uncharacterized protein n=1 Tax=Araneus ventricosus TaxID=182803 RepID=A0A4Y2RPN4_ARAVE|nr:hypothetical protein AVEN_217876-1 [Araneus ventricosus]